MTENTPHHNLGFAQSFFADTTPLEEPFSYARITEVNRGNYKISDGERESIAELSGKFLFSVESSIDYPTVGDWVVAHFLDDSIAIIHELLPRRSLLKRLDPGKSIEFQLIGANIDYAFIVQSANANFDINRLERYLVMVNNSGITPVIVLTKTDLISESERETLLLQLEQYRSKYQIVAISSLSGDGIDSLQQLLKSNKTYSLLGSSGVGKTTLLNYLVGEKLFDVKEIREKDDKGKHTTTRRQLIQLSSGAIFVDTPGMRELGNFGVESGIETTFDTILLAAQSCRFSDCTHTSEQGCAVIDSVESGEITEEQYHNFLKIQKESDFYEMSSQDRKKKDKKLGKTRKNYLKTMRKK